MISEAKRAVILIVEDELLIRINAVEMIEVAGFEVVEAASADEAIAILDVAWTLMSSSPISKCRAVWMV